MIALTICFTLFSFKSVEINELELSNMDNFTIVQTSSSSISTTSKNAWVVSAARAVGRGAVKAAKWAWGKNYVIAAALEVAHFIGPTQVASSPDLTREVRLAQL